MADPDPLLARADAAIAEGVRLRIEVQIGVERAIAAFERFSDTVARPIMQPIRAMPASRYAGSSSIPARAMRPTEIIRRENEELERAWKRIERTITKALPSLRTACHAPQQMP